VVNPENVKGEFKEEVWAAGSALADAMEQIAKGVRMRASQ
jgi:hypothetical protein